MAIVASYLYAYMIIKEFNKPLISEIIIGVARRSICKISSVQVWSAGSLEGVVPTRLQSRYGEEHLKLNDPSYANDISSRL